jgi:hypothetical protein
VGWTRVTYEEDMREALFEPMFVDEGLFVSSLADDSRDIDD